MDDRDLLRDYVERHSEQAFAELVARHLPGVLATAQRLLREPQAAADVAQTVFIQLARKAWTIREGQVLSGWLYRDTRHAAFNALRHEQRRQQRETTAMKDAKPPTHSAPGWEDLAPLVDEALRQLQRPEQDVVLLRFFEDKSFAEIGRLLNLDEKTAGQRANRALEKMRRYFSQRGVTTTALLLGSALGAHGAATLPVGMAAQVAGASLAGTGGTTSFALLLKTLYMTTSTKLILATAIVVAVATVSTITQQREISQLRAELSAKNAVAAQSTPAKHTNLSPADALAKAKADLAKVLKTPGSRSRRDRALIDFADSLDVGTLADLITDLKAKPVPDLDVLNFLFTRWAELNPSAALDSVESMHVFHKADLALSVLDTWALKDPVAALAASTRTQGDETLRSIAQEDILTDMVKQNPQAAVTALRNLPGGSESAFLYQSVFNTWADLNPSAAATGALNLPPSSLRNAALVDVAQGWAYQDSSAALAWANTLPDGLAKNGAVDEVIEAMSSQDPQSAANYALNLPHGSNDDPLLQVDPFTDSFPGSGGGDPLLGQIASIWAQQNPAALLTWANTNLTGANFDTAANAALKQMIGTDPVVAAAALAQIPDASVVSQNIPLLATQWSEQAPQAALTWAQSLPTDNVALRNSAVAAALQSWTTSDPVAAAAYIQQNLTTDPAFSTLATQVVNSWSQADPQAALTWAENLPQGTAQNSAVSAAITALATVDPQTAWNDVQQLSGTSGNAAMVNVINAWANQQPAQAAAALQNLPPGSSLDTATADVAKSWLSQDPNAASQWIDTLPQGAARDSAVTQLISSVSQNDPASAFNWAVTLGDPTTRNTQVVELATQWSNQNPAAAAAAAQNALGNLTGLTDAQQTALQKVVAKAPGP